MEGFLDGEKREEMMYANSRRLQELAIFFLNIGELANWKNATRFLVY